MWQRRGWKLPRRVVEASVAELGKSSQRKSVGCKLGQIGLIWICGIVVVDRLQISTLAWHQVSSEGESLLQAETKRV
jgi:hypothetical protein